MNELRFAHPKQGPPFGARRIEVERPHGKVATLSPLEGENPGRTGQAFAQSNGAQPPAGVKTRHVFQGIAALKRVRVKGLSFTRPAHSTLFGGSNP